MQYKVQLLLLFLIGTSFQRLIAQEAEIVTLKPDTSTTFHWGAITVPLTDMKVNRKEGRLTVNVDCSGLQGFKNLVSLDIQRIKLPKSSRLFKFWPFTVSLYSIPIRKFSIIRYASTYS